MKRFAILLPVDIFAEPPANPSTVDSVEVEFETEFPASIETPAYMAYADLGQYDLLSVLSHLLLSGSVLTVRQSFLDESCVPLPDVNIPSTHTGQYVCRNSRDLLTRNAFY
jgi:hypothetical protein